MSVDNENAFANTAEHIPILEEHLSLTKRTVEAGRVRVRISNETNERRLQAELRSEAVEIERVAIGRELSIGEPLPVPHEQEDGRVLVVPVLEEVLVVEKRWVLREELRLHRRASTQQVEEQVTVLRQQTDIERLPSTSPRNIEQSGL